MLLTPVKEWSCWPDVIKFFKTSAGLLNFSVDNTQIAQRFVLSVVHGSEPKNGNDVDVTQQYFQQFSIHKLQSAVFIFMAQTSQSSHKSNLN